MGIQQTLLLVLLTIIVGLALVSSVNVVENRMVQHNQDAVRQDMIRASTMAQALWERPVILGGAGRNFSGHFTEAELLSVLQISGWPTEDGDIQNENGVYSIEEISESGFTMNAKPSYGNHIKRMQVWMDESTRRWEVQIAAE
ncbi:hypothetical protein QLX67_10075 [Balneolaceae bacterium ANBcel3]|nr:hypothetical protein [Balneolaceae bacterium ANBcel3]